jgi:hypothetical protein
MKVKLASCQTPTTCTFGGNRYTYVRHNPMKYVDPSGHIAFIPLLILGAKLAVAGAATSAAVDASIQVAANYQDTGNFASDIGTSASKINLAQVGGAAIGGALTGPILGAGGAAIRSVGFKGIEKAVGYTAYSSLAGAVGSAASTASSTLLTGQNVDYAATYKSALVGSVAGPIGSGIGTGMQRSTSAAINALKSATAQTANVQVPVATQISIFSTRNTLVARQTTLSIGVRVSYHTAAKRLLEGYMRHQVWQVLLLLNYPDS